MPRVSQPAPPVDPASLTWDERGLIPAVVQDARTGELLTLAWMSRESLARTLERGETWFWSRSRQELWHKGETSGHVQRVVDVTADCDQDALRVRVIPAGPACHTGAASCFHAPLTPPASETLGGALDALLEVIARRKQELPEGSYTTYLFQAGLNKVLKKVGEEATEVVLAAKGAEHGQVVYESADLLYHLAVLWRATGVRLDEVAAELASRRRP